MYLEGASFGPISDLGSPDALIAAGSITINVLPFVMTAINLLSAAVYANKMPFKSKVQLFIMAALFLVLLYNSPSGMVLYWTCNNLFSLVKNIVMKLISKNKKPAKAAKAEKKAKKADPAPMEAPAEKQYSKEEVRGILAKKANEAEGRFKADVKAIVQKYGNGGSLTNVDPKDYAALVTEVEGLTDA
jgi:hypothetical protein